MRKITITIVFGLAIIAPFISFSQDQRGLFASASINTNETLNTGYNLALGTYGMQSSWLGFQMDIGYNSYKTRSHTLNFLAATYNFRFKVKKVRLYNGIQFGYLLNRIVDENDDRVAPGRLAISGGLGYFIREKWEIAGRVNIPTSNKFYDADIQVGMSFHIK